MKNKILEALKKYFSNTSRIKKLNNIDKSISRIDNNASNIESVIPDDLHHYEEDYGKDYAKYKFVNIGAGKFKRTPWTTIDYVQPAYADHLKNHVPDINLDLSLSPSLPFDDESVMLVYSSHTFEHLKDDMVQHIINEIYRVLISKRGGGAIGSSKYGECLFGFTA
ncbi:hypothetical protein FACS1894206_09680 [Deltaproteobacteria bacterium]|nr:hypothetical protein FACS1894206_09680 [Deltaproteobacteria bacterium]